MKTLTSAERRALRAKAHHLSPCVSVGQHGLTAAVLHEVDVALRAHELIKIRVFSDERDERELLLARICDALDAAPVQHLGKLLIVWRPAPEPVADEQTRSPHRKDRATVSDRKHRAPATGRGALPVAASTRRRHASVRGR